MYFFSIEVFSVKYVFGTIIRFIISETYQNLDNHIFGFEKDSCKKIKNEMLKYSLNMHNLEYKKP